METGSCYPRKPDSTPSLQKSFVTICTWCWFYRHERWNAWWSHRVLHHSSLELLRQWNVRQGWGSFKKVLGGHCTQLWKWHQICSGSLRILEIPESWKILSGKLLHKGKHANGEARCAPGSRAGWVELYKVFGVQIISSGEPDAGHESAKFDAFLAGLVKSVLAMIFINSLWNESGYSVSYIGNM